MQISSIRLENVRRYVEPVVLDQLAPGLNLIVGPNGAGKSTWVRALRVAFFAFHRSRQMKDLIPWAAPGASPRITVDFSVDGEQYQLSKQFFKGAFVRLQTPAEVLEADLAEARIATLLGFEPVTRGEARHTGVPGLLWLEQGARPLLNGPDGPLEQARDYLREALGNAMGEVASTGGDEVLQKLEAELNQLRVRGRDNSAKGELAAALTALQEAEQRYQVLQGQLTEFRDRVDRLGRLRTEIERDRLEKPWEKLQAQAAEAQTRLSSLAREQTRLEQLRQEAGHLQARKTLLTREVLRQKALLASRDDRERAQRAAREAVDVLLAQRQLVSERLENARKAFEQSQQQLELARGAEQQNTLGQREKELAEQLSQFKRRLASAQTCQERIETLTALLSQKTALPGSLQRLREIEQERALLSERMSASGTEIRFDLTREAAVFLDGDSLSGQGRRILTTEQTLHLEGVGSVSIKPGSAELDQSRRAQQLLQTEYEALLNQSGHDSTDALARALERQRQADAACQVEQARLKELAPQGLDQLSLRLAQYQGELEHVQEQSVRLNAATARGRGAQATPPVSVDSAQAALDTATGLREQAEQADRSAAEALSEARSVLRHAEQELLIATQAQQEEQHPDGNGATESAVQTLQTLSEQLTTLETNIGRLNQTIHAGMPETLALDVQRYSESAKQAQETARRHEIEEAGMAAELSQAGAAGLEETFQLAGAELARCRDRASDLTIRADALTWLVNQIRERRQALTTRLQAPLQQRMDYYLKQLLPGVQLQMNADLAPDSIQTVTADERSEALREAVSEQSYGTQEQISLVARLAYADLLASAGRATLLMIDDGILNTDGERLERVKRILYDASQRHQVLLFSCHPERWSGLGVGARDVP